MKPATIKFRVCVSDQCHRWPVTEQKRIQPNAATTLEEVPGGQGGGVEAPVASAYACLVLWSRGQGSAWCPHPGVGSRGDDTANRTPNRPGKRRPTALKCAQGSATSQDDFLASHLLAARAPAPRHGTRRAAPPPPRATPPPAARARVPCLCARRAAHDARREAAPSGTFATCRSWRRSCPWPCQSRLIRVAFWCTLSTPTRQSGLGRL